ncbi:Cof-type HAD-IIB family hydrolase [Velocimicrobium porci]|uniref:HAD family phosphatase n=1 Tax=Velocimicrobium porci TaxID=2606634 RepID=A0A6L5XXI7_9FIRM|nr:Cof-type HAD-IIB family hydrolase [Velocimicrobium porci]MSS63580.1 HAD family phosphatase [Velocimicrobium porci]
MEQKGKKIKLVGLDLDGTVFDDEKHISKKTIQTIEKAIKQGVIIVPATGRPIIGVPKELLNIDGISYALTANGAAIYNTKTKECIYHDCMEYETCASIIHVLDQYDVMADVFIDGMGYVEKKKQDRNMEYAMPQAVRKYILSTRKTVDCLEQFILDDKRGIEKITVNFKTNTDGSLHCLKEVKQELEKFSGLAVVSGVSTNLEITRQSATKGNGLIVLGNLLGIDKEEIMACGDSGNDREMLKAVGFGVAMENATADVKEVADYITKSNTEDGVAYAIETFVLEKGK